MNRFWQHQIKELREGGFSVLLRKLRTFLLVMVPAVLTIPIILSLRALRPLILIRFGRLKSSRIGHFSIETEIYLCERDAGMYPKRTFDVFYHSKSHIFRSPKISNQQLKKMWSRTIHISRLARLLYISNRWLPGYKDHEILLPSVSDIHGLLEHTEPHLSFTPEEERIGLNGLRKLGIPEGAPFVCFHARDSAYLDSVAPQGKWRYHDCRDVNVKDYIPAAEELTRRGYFVLRMGAMVKEALNVKNPMIIDYATKGRNDFLDVYLCAKCHFFLASPSGLADLARTFRRPIAWANLISLEFPSTGCSNYLFIPKKLWSRKENRFLTFREILDSGAGTINSSEEYEHIGVDIVDNTPEEIISLTKEMDERLKGTWQTTEEDKRLQLRFWNLFRKRELKRPFRAKIGADFLCQNRELLE